jgi:hypothetical protein
MSAVGTASANSLLFPYFKVGAGVQSVLSLSNSSSTASSEDIHYSYGVGATCAHYDTWGRLTANDIISHSVAAPGIGGLGVVPANDTSLPGYLPQNDTYGFLIVSNVSTASTNALRGSMAVIEAATTGLFVSYAGIDNALNTVSAAPGKYSDVVKGNVNEGDFSVATLAAAGQGPATVALNFPLTWLPTAAVYTSWWALPIGNMNAFARGASQNWLGTFALKNLQNNVWDNDENYVSGAKDVAAGCQQNFQVFANTAFPTVPSLLTPGQEAAFKVDPIMSKGGMSGMYKGTGSVAAGADNVILMKNQKVTSGSAAYDRGTLQHRELGQATF